MLEKPVGNLKGVGASVDQKLNRLGIKTFGDLIRYYPRRYDDYSYLSKISQVSPGGVVSIRVKIVQIKGRYARRGLHITEAVATDDTGSIRIVWFNQPYRERATKTGAEYFISGPFEFSAQRMSIMNPSMELVSNFPINSARIVPIYRETKGLKSATIRKIIRDAASEIKRLPESLPKDIISENKLTALPKALSDIHLPDSQKELEQAKKRLGFEELFTLSMASLINKQQNQSEKGLKIEFDVKLAKKFVSELPYKLTDAQRKVIWKIYQDIASETPMNRLVEGDVGSGKTVVATMASLMVLARNLQVAVMAPTELLARQHAESIREMLEPMGMKNKVALLLGSMKSAQKKTVHQAIASGRAGIVVGTHALISEKVDMHRLGLVVIDEQHRFGVNQRKNLLNKAGHMPHLLSMTATPIPRSLALTLYGELDISIIDEMPVGKKPVKTEVITPSAKPELYAKIDNELAAGKQMFVACPLIEQSGAFNFLSAEEVYKDFSANVFKHRKVALLHGKMKPEIKEATMQDFADGKLDILVSTTVIEVGVHVPNATVMLVEGVERFGLAQIHQLRGRVGRGGQQGYCYLLLSEDKSPSRRVKALTSTNDGFKLAQLDLEIRGPGAIYGSAQHGQLDLRIANLTDAKLIASVRASAQQFIDSGKRLEKYPDLAKKVEQFRAVTTLN